MTTARNPYELGPAAKAVFLQWWHTVSSETAGGGSRADRANLKRAGDLTAVACTPAYQRVYRDMVAANGGLPWPPLQQERIAALIGLAAHVKSRVPMSLPQAMSHHLEGADRNPVSDLRFSRLLNSPDIEALFIGLRRCLPLIDYQVDTATLADDVFEWGDAVKKRWAYAYKWPAKDGG